MKKKLAHGVGNLGAEEKDQLEAKVKTRAMTRAEAEALFANKSTQESDRRLLKKLFIQAPAAETKNRLAAKMEEAPKEELLKDLGALYKTKVSAATDAYFEKLAEDQLTEAQRRYPELLKVAAAPGGRGTYVLPSITKRTVTTNPVRGAGPVQSSLSGGTA